MTAAFLPYRLVEMSTSETTEVRELFVPSRAVSWEAQMDRAVRLAHSGLTVRLHRHGAGAKCWPKSGASPNEWCARIELHSDGESTNVVPVSETESETTKSD